jgi:dihydroorotase
MRLLIKRALILDPHSRHHRKRLDVYVKKGIITRIGRNLKVTADAIVQSGNLCISPGWLDIGAQGGEPGYEHREDLASLAQAAIAGGYTGIACFPNTKPALHSKSEIEFIRNKSASLPIDVFPIGSISEDCAGKDLAELYDMHATGAVAFSDGRVPTAHAGLMLRALQYVLSFNGLIINRPDDRYISPEGQIHESETSIGLGLKGIPSIREHIMLERDLRILEYTGSRLHTYAISTAESTSLLRQAVKSGLRASGSVVAANLLLEDSDVADFDTNLKVLPPLRARSDRKALIRAVKDGVINCIVSNHEPVEEEHKKMEFGNADFGSTGLETAFALANTACLEQVPLEDLVAFFAQNPRDVLGLKVPLVDEKEDANLTLFDPEITWTVALEHLTSRSANAAALGRELQGCVLGVVSKGTFHLAAEK